MSHLFFAKREVAHVFVFQDMDDVREQLTTLKKDNKTLEKELRGQY